MSPRAAILLPLYIYPEHGAWEPLHKAISDHPHVKFIVILNPHNGPGASPFPDAEYSQEIPRLNSQPNVRTVGYVRTNYCNRDLAEVLADVNRYAGWSKGYAESDLAVHGIFLDETSNQYSANVSEYLHTVDQKVKDASGILGERLMIHNPGTIPDAGLANPGPDITTVVEESLAQYRSSWVQERIATLHFDRSKCSYMVHSVPREEVKEVVRELRLRGNYLFVTDLREDYYCHFGPSWSDFVLAMQMD